MRLSSFSPSSEFKTNGLRVAALADGDLAHRSLFYSYSSGGTHEETAFMLRITAYANSGTRIRLIVEGRLIGPWIKELEAAIIESRSACESIHLDLSGLRFADEQGLSLLRRLVGENVILERISPFIQELLGTCLE